MNGKPFYLAAASREWSRARAAMRTLEDGGFRNAHDWTPHVEHALASGTSESKLDDEIAARIAREDLDGVGRSDVLVLLAPDDGGKMCWGEYCYALAHRIPCVTAHPNGDVARQSILTRLGAITTDVGLLDAVREVTSAPRAPTRVLTITPDARLAIDRYTAVKVESALIDELTPRTREEARSYACEALFAILMANPEAFDFVAQMDAVKARKAGR